MSFGAKSKTSKLEETKLPKETIALWSYTPNCSLYRIEEGKYALTWDDGKAVQATRGGAKDYIPNHMKMHFDAKTHAYAPNDDYAAMVAAKVDSMLAFLIVLMRQIAVSLPGTLVSETEALYVDVVIDSMALDNKVLTALEVHGKAIDSICQQTFTIMALNGISMISRGHHYSADDKFWDRFKTAVAFDDDMSRLKVTNYEGAILHDLLHPLDIDYLARMASDVQSPLRTKIHGVASKRLGTVPAGCTVVQLFIVMLERIQFKNKEFASAFTEVRVVAVERLEEIRIHPLDYCINMPRSVTENNLSRVVVFEPLVALCLGYLQNLENVDNRDTLISAKSLKNVRDRQAAAYELGRAAAETYKPEKLDKTFVNNAVGLLLASVKKAGEIEDLTSKDSNSNTEPKRREKGDSFGT
jgi:hypothetical protein